MPDMNLIQELIMKKLLIVIDMQNDFLTGSLANKDAVSAIPNIIKEMEKADFIVFTRDTHDASNYMNTQEGKKLPVLHCVKDTPGWQVEQSLLDAAGSKSVFVDKPTFGWNGWKDFITRNNLLANEVEFTGTCTDICVVSNALAFKAAFPEVKVSAKADCCAGLTKEKHEAALEVMRSCQIEVF